MKYIGFLNRRYSRYLPLNLPVHIRNIVFNGNILKILIN